MPDAPQVSVLMPSLNQFDFIEIAARSVLEQRDFSVELIISDGGSTDGTLGLLENLLIEFGPRIRWVSAADEGPGSAINRALQHCRADIVGWLNADDIYAPDAVSVAVRRFSADAELVMVYGEAEFVDAAGNILRRYPTRPPSVGIEAFQSGCFICQPTAFLRRWVFDTIGGLDERLSTAFDFDLWLRVFGNFPGRIGHTDRIQAFSRVHGRTITSSQREAVASEAVRLLSRYLGSADPHWVLTYIDEATRAYPSYSTSVDLHGHVSAMVTELAACFDRQALARLRSLVDQDRRLVSVSEGVHADMFPDGWAKRNLSLRIRAPLSGSFSLILRCEHGRPDDAPIKLRILSSGGTVMTKSIAHCGQFEITNTFADVRLGQLIFVSVYSDSTFIPSLTEKGSTDTRELAYRITRILVVALP
jgi:glycosyltransferase involved in cell wall biosynthesis